MINLNADGLGFSSDHSSDFCSILLATSSGVCQETSSWDAENPRLNNSLWLLILLSSQSESGGKDCIRNKCSLEALDYGRMTLKNNQHNLGKTFMKRTYPARRKSKNLEPNFGPCFLNCPPKKSSETHLQIPWFIIMFSVSQKNFGANTISGLTHISQLVYCMVSNSDHLQTTTN